MTAPDSRTVDQAAIGRTASRDHWEVLMAMPPRDDPTWQALVERPDAHAYQFLALKIMLQRIARRPPTTPAEVDAAADEVYAFFVKNERLVAADIQTIFG